MLFDYQYLPYPESCKTDFKVRPQNYKKVAVKMAFNCHELAKIFLKSILIKKTLREIG